LARSWPPPSRWLCRGRRKRTPPLESEKFRSAPEGRCAKTQGDALWRASDACSTASGRCCAPTSTGRSAPRSAGRARATVAALLGRGRAAALDCGDAASAADLAPGAEVRHCREQGSGLEWTSYAVARDGWLHVVEGYRAFDSALRLTLASLAENRAVPATVDIVTTGGRARSPRRAPRSATTSS
jgi:hypothetical protein